MGTLVIWKFPIKLSGEFEVEIPSEFRVIAVAAQRNYTPSDEVVSEPCFWAIVNPEAKKVMRTFVLRTTGETFFGDLKYAETDPMPQYLGTFLINNDNFVGHLFQKKVKSS